MDRKSRYANNTYEQWLERAQRFCASRERCASEVLRYLDGFDCPPALMQQVVVALTSDGFIDELRFARAFARDKARLSAWGEIKIRHALAARRVSREAIDEVLRDLHESGELPDLYAVLSRKVANMYVNEEDTVLWARLLRFAYSRGFHPEEAQRIVRQVMREHASPSSEE